MIATIVLDRPDTRNALSFSAFHELGQRIEAAAADPSTRFIIIRGAGGTFSSGGDLSDLSQGLDAGYVADYWRRMAATILRLRSLTQIVIAGVDGPAVGAGAALALAADLVIATRRSKFRWSFGHVGYLPDAGTALTLSQALGAPRARELLLTGRWMPAEEAMQAGLIARLAEDGDLDEAIAGAVDELAKSPPLILALAKNLIDQAALPTFAASVRADGVHQLAASISRNNPGQAGDNVGVVEDGAPDVRTSSQ